MEIVSNKQYCWKLLKFHANSDHVVTALCASISHTGHRGSAIEWYTHPLRPKLTVVHYCLYSALRRPKHDRVTPTHSEKNYTYCMYTMLLLINIKSYFILHSKCVWSLWKVINALWTWVRSKAVRNVHSAWKKHLKHYSILPVDSAAMKRLT